MIYKLQNGKIKNTAPEKQGKRYMAEGGRLFKTGGLSGPINPNILRQAVKQMFLRAVPRNILVGAADLADEVAGIPSFQQIKEIPKVGKFYTNALDNRESEYYEDGYIENPGLTFLLDLGRQSKMLQKMGYHPVNDGYYGSVTSATRKLNALKGYAIPIFQKGDDEVDFSEVEPIADKDGNYFFERTSYLGDIFGKNELNHASYHPVSFYRHKRTGDIYVRGYDLNDYGKHNKNMWKHLPEALGNSLFNEGYSYDKTGQTYGDEQYLAEIYDYIGNPFVQRTALIKAPEKLVKKYFGDNYASGGKIHIKSENRRKLFEEGGPDGIDLHKNGGIIKLQKGKVLPIIRKIAKPISEAERLGIPKALRSSPKALEDPYYWGYQQWNSRYNAAVNSRNLQEAQRLRDLHFKIKAPDTKVVDENGMPLHTYHGFLPSRRGVFTKFKGVNFGVEHIVKEGSKTNHWKLSIPNEHRMTSYHTPNYNHALTSYASGNPDNVYDDYLNIKNPFTWNEENLHNILLNSGHTSEKIPFREPGRFRKIAVRDSNGNLLTDENGSIIFKDSDIWIPEKSGFRYPQISDWADFRGNSKTELMKLGYDGLYIPQYYDSYGAFVSPSQFKSAEPITRTDSGEIIPIVKRDNFHNLDRRYKQGGKI